MKTATPVPAPGTESVVFYFDYNGRHKQHQRKLDGIRRYAKARAWQVLALSPEESKPGDARALLAQRLSHVDRDADEVEKLKGWGLGS